MARMRRLAAAMLLLTGCNLLVSADQRRIDAAQQEVAALLRDPATAQFRNVRIKRTTPSADPDMAFVCGEVNGINAFGGRAGFKRFIAMPKVNGPDGDLMRPLLEETSPSPDAFAREWATAC